jgi:hypothetical protein
LRKPQRALMSLHPSDPGTAHPVHQHFRAGFIPMTGDEHVK